MVLDTDTYNEIDDQFAVVYALISPELDVQAVYAAPFQNARSTGPGDGMEKSYEEIQRILSRLDKIAGRFRLQGKHALSRSEEARERARPLLDLIERAKKSSPEDPLYVVAVGCITNVSNAILLEPSIIRNIVVVWLGGNGHPLAPSARVQLPAGSPRVARGVRLWRAGRATSLHAGRDALRHHGTRDGTLRGGPRRIGDYLLEIFKDYHKDHFGWSKVLWDMTAVAWLIRPQDLPSDLVHSPIVTDNYTFSFDQVPAFHPVGQLRRA